MVLASVPKAAATGRPRIPPKTPPRTLPRTNSTDLMYTDPMHVHRDMWMRCGNDNHERSQGLLEAVAVRKQRLESKKAAYLQCKNH